MLKGGPGGMRTIPLAKALLCMLVAYADRLALSKNEQNLCSTHEGVMYYV
jgi:hypothetical protein